MERQLRLDLTDPDQQRAELQRYLAPLEMPPRQVAVLCCVAAHGMRETRDGQSLCVLRASKANLARLTGCAANTFLAGAEDLENAGLISIVRITRPWTYVANFSRIAKLEPAPSDPLAGLPVCKPNWGQVRSTSVNVGQRRSTSVNAGQPFIDTKEEETFNLPKSQRSDQSVVNDIERPPPGSTDKLLAKLESGLLATLERIDSGGPRRVPETNRGPQRMSADLFADAAIARLEASAKPAEQKRRLKKRIKSVCGDGPTGPLADWTAGQTAELVIHGHLPEEDLERIFGDIEAYRAKGTLENAPAFFCSKVKQRADQLGLPFGKQEEAAR